jgi:hypothetical protein
MPEMVAEYVLQGVGAPSVKELVRKIDDYILRYNRPETVCLA